MEDPEIMSTEAFVSKYINFQKELVKAEKSLDKKYRLKSRQRAELFQFHFVDQRNQQDMQRLLEERRREAENHDEDNENEGPEFWESDED